jgi:hypothetical protein
LFQSLSTSICDRNTSIGGKGLWNEALNLSSVYRWYYRYRDGREQAEHERGGRPKSTPAEINMAALVDLVKKK